MNKNQIAEYNMYKVVILTCEAHAIAWDEKPYFSATYADFRENTHDIEALVGVQLSDTTGVAAHKQARRAELESLAMRVANALRMYAIHARDVDLERLIDYSPSDLRLSSETHMLGIVDIIQRKAIQLGAVLVPYGITDAMARSLGTKKTDYLALVGTPRTAEAPSIEATQKIRELMDVNQRLLRELDVAIRVLQPEADAFYRDFLLARRIVNAPGRTRALDISVADALTQEPLGGAKLFVEPLGLNKRSSAKGRAWVQTCPEGNVQLVCSHPGYETQNIEGVIYAGQTTKLKVLMHKVP